MATKPHGTDAGCWTTASIPLVSHLIIFGHEQKVSMLGMRQLCFSQPSLGQRGALQRLGLWLWLHPAAFLVVDSNHSFQPSIFSKSDRHFPKVLVVFWKEGSLERMGKVPLERSHVFHSPAACSIIWGPDAGSFKQLEPIVAVLS